MTTIMRPYACCPCHRRLCEALIDDDGIIKGICAINGSTHVIREQDFLGVIEGGRSRDAVTTPDDPLVLPDDIGQTEA
jgi:hypothetical protein